MACPTGCAGSKPRSVPVRGHRLTIHNAGETGLALRPHLLDQVREPSAESIIGWAPNKVTFGESSGSSTCMQSGILPRGAVGVMCAIRAAASLRHSFAFANSRRSNRERTELKVKMNAIVWLAVGGVIGWLASLVMKTDNQQGFC